MSLTPVDLFIFINYACRSLYELNFMEAKPARGFYRLTVSVAPKKADSRLIGTTGAEVCECVHAFVCVCVWARIFWHYETYEMLLNFVQVIDSYLIFNRYET